jgi:hypothetical protein
MTSVIKSSRSREPVLPEGIDELLDKDPPSMSLIRSKTRAKSIKISAQKPNESYSEVLDPDSNPILDEIEKSSVRKSFAEDTLRKRQEQKSVQLVTEPERPLSFRKVTPPKEPSPGQSVLSMRLNPKISVNNPSQTQKYVFDRGIEKNDDYPFAGSTTEIARRYPEIPEQTREIMRKEARKKKSDVLFKDLVDKEMDKRKMTKEIEVPEVGDYVPETYNPKSPGEIRNLRIDAEMKFRKEEEDFMKESDKNDLRWVALIVIGLCLLISIVMMIYFMYDYIKSSATWEEYEKKWIVYVFGPVLMISFILIGTLVL